MRWTVHAKKFFTQNFCSPVFTCFVATVFMAHPPDKQLEMPTCATVVFQTVWHP